MKYLKWIRLKGEWIGSTRTGKKYIVRCSMRGGHPIVYLDRPNYGTEVCRTIGHAKEYANELARLAGFPAWSSDKPFEYDERKMFPFVNDPRRMTD